MTYKINLIAFTSQFTFSTCTSHYYFILANQNKKSSLTETKNSTLKETVGMPRAEMDHFIKTCFGNAHIAHNQSAKVDHNSNVLNNTDNKLTETLSIQKYLI